MIPKTSDHDCEPSTFHARKPDSVGLPAESNALVPTIQMRPSGRSNAIGFVVGGREPAATNVPSAICGLAAASCTIWLPSTVGTCSVCDARSTPMRFT
jgi:hypothetical protein